MSARAERRDHGIDVLRGIAILLVLFHHFNIAYRLSDTTLARVFGPDAVLAVARNGNYGVTMFFVISGYLITANAARRWSGLGNVAPGAFYGLRIARILPCLLLLLAIVNALAAGGVAIFQNHADSGAAPSFWLVNLASLTFWMNVLIGAHGWVNYPLGVLWSLSVEEVFYLAFPLLCVVLRRESRLVMFWLAIIVVGPVYRYTHQGDEENFLYAYFACFDAIAIGCCTALLARRVTLRGPLRAWLRGLTAVAMTGLYLAWPISDAHVLGVTAMALGTAVLLLTGPAPDTETARRSSRAAAPFEWFGRLSYELYLFHLIVLGLLKTHFPRAAVTGDDRLALLALYLLLSAALGWLIARVYSEPLNRGIRRRLTRGASPSRRGTPAGTLGPDA
jgi:peptidoglycan/LPS O-acetylase OafA/YrhL